MSNPDSASASTPRLEPDPYDDGISLAPYFRILWDRRRLLGLIMGAAALLFLLGVVFAYFWYPNYKVAQVSFRLLFDGADRGQYPNGTKFGPSDIVALPILEEVYKNTGLEEYGKFDLFKSSLVVIQTSTRLEQLDQEYKARLADTKLSPVDRQNMEREFAARRESLNTAEFALSMTRRERLREMPSGLAQKVLQDILDGFAKYADQQKGALKYRVSVPSRNIIPTTLLEDEDYIVALDVLRTTIARIRQAVTQIQALPNADTVRVGQNRLALVDISARLEDLLRFQVSPMIGFVRATGVTKNAAVTTQYLRNQLFTINLDRNVADRRAAVYTENLRSYQSLRTDAPVGAGGQRQPSLPSGGIGNVPALIPQLGDSFFDRLIELGSKGDDTAYRQEMITKATGDALTVAGFDKEVAYYEDLIRVFEGAAARSSASARQEFLAVFNKRYPRIFDEVLQSIDDVNLFYDTLSTSNLNPTTLLVEVTRPASASSSSSLSARRVLLGGGLYFFLVGLLVVVGAIIYGRIRENAA